MTTATAVQRNGSRSSASPGATRSRAGIVKKEDPSTLPEIAAASAKAAAANANGEDTSVSSEKHSEPSDSAAILQIYLLSGARGVFQMSRICMGPLVVSMSFEFGYTTEQKGQILSAFAAGYALTQIVGGLAADRLGGAPVIMFGLLTSGLSLFLLPWAAEAGLVQVWWLLWAMGFTQGPTYPAQLVTTAKWVTGSLRSYASALGAAGSTAGALFALGLTPIISSRVGWRQASFLMGVSTLLFGVIWWCLGSSRPPFRSDVDSGLAAATAPSTPSGKGSASWSDILFRRVKLLTSLPVLAVYFAHSVHNFSRYFLTGWMPTYYNDILHASADNTAVQLMIPDIIGLTMSFVAAHLGRTLQQGGYLSALGVRRVFASIAFLGAALGLVLVAQARSVLGVTASLCLVHGLATLQGLGFGASYLDVSRHNSGLVTGVGNTVATLASFASPVFASWVLTLNGSDTNGVEDWQRLFFAFAGSNIAGVLVFVPFVSVTPQDLDDEPRPRSKAD